MANLKIYPSGFYGPVDVRQTAPTEAQFINSRTTSYGIPIRYEVTSSIEAEALFKELDFKMSVDFDFAHRALTSAKTHLCFSTEVPHLTLGEWVNMQMSGPEWSTYHCDWVEETIGYVFFDKARKLSFNNWILMLSSRFNKGANSIKKKPNLNPGQADIPMSRFVAMWAAKPGGLNDLVCSGKILFGDVT